jgi:hypothetical protein
MQFIRIARNLRLGLRIQHRALALLTGTTLRQKQADAKNPLGFPAVPMLAVLRPAD